MLFSVGTPDADVTAAAGPAGEAGGGGGAVGCGASESQRATAQSAASVFPVPVGASNAATGHIGAAAEANACKPGGAGASSREEMKLNMWSARLNCEAYGGRGKRYSFAHKNSR